MLGNELTILYPIVRYGVCGMRYEIICGVRLASEEFYDI